MSKANFGFILVSSGMCNKKRTTEEKVLRRLSEIVAKCFFFEKLCWKFVIWMCSCFSCCGCMNDECASICFLVFFFPRSLFSVAKKSFCWTCKYTKSPKQNNSNKNQINSLKSLFCIHSTKKNTRHSAWNTKMMTARLFTSKSNVVFICCRRSYEILYTIDDFPIVRLA